MRKTIWTFIEIFIDIAFADRLIENIDWSTLSIWDFAETTSTNTAIIAIFVAQTIRFWDSWMGKRGPSHNQKIFFNKSEIDASIFNGYFHWIVRIYLK